jgi:hypothetical protein
VIEQDHLLSRLGMRDVEDTDERLVIEMDTVPTWSTSVVPSRAAWSRH